MTESFRTPLISFSMDFSSEDRLQDFVPSYEESIQQGAKVPNSSGVSSKSQFYPSMSLDEQLATVRSNRINSIITSYIDPLLLAQSLSGLFKTTFVLVPSNVNSLQPLGPSSEDIIEGSGDTVSHDQQEAIVGFPSEDYIKLVRLHGDEYTLEFWRQSAVIKELDSALKARLKASGHKLARTTTDPQPETTTTPIEPPKVKKGYFSRKSSTAATAAPPSPSPVSTGTWKFEKEEAVAHGHVRVKVGLQTVCMRVVTEMGLYETRNGSAVVVNVEIGG
jgi:hypothetical protein